MTEQPPTPATPPDQSAIAQHLSDRANAPGSEHEIRQRGDSSAGDNVSRETQREDDQREDDGHGEGEGDNDQLRQSFDREYVERLRTKSAGYRLRAKEAEQALDTARRALFQERLQRLDLVVDVEAVPYDPELLEDSDALQSHVEQLLESKPYLRKRRAYGNIGQHSRQGDGGGGVSLLGMMKKNT